MNAVISARILNHLAAGMPLEQAFDAVLGAGAYVRLAGDLYDSIRIKAAA